MKFLYAPWRTVYAKQVDTGKLDNTTALDCDFCRQLQAQEDARYFILARYKYTFACLNHYPYNAGHLMIIPFEHKSQLSDFSQAAHNEIMQIMSASTHILQTVLQCHGINIGINLGKAAGAGIPSHLHVHVLPRWNGDTNFVPLLANTKIISVNLNEIYHKLKPAFDQLTL